MDSDDLILTSADPHRVRGLLRHPERPSAAGVVILPEVSEVHVYPDAVHSFFDRRYEEYREECDGAWRRMLDFIERHA